MKAKELKKLSDADLLKMYNELLEDLFKLRFKHGIRRLENPAKLGLLRRDIARIKTILAEKMQ